jgi:hypothetical protein
MVPISTPSGDSLSISTPPRRGRPKKHANAAAKAKAYRRRCKSRKLRSLGTTEERAAAAWEKLSTEEKAYVQECIALTQQIQSAESNEDFEEVLRLRGMLEYTEQIERQRLREARFAASAKLLSPNQGVLMHDAPHGMGILISKDDVAADSDIREAREECGGGHRVAAAGRSSDDGREWPESDWTWIKRQEKDFLSLTWTPSKEHKALHLAKVVVEKPTCCRCGSLASNIHPDDKRKRLSEVRFLCGKHALRDAKPFNCQASETGLGNLPKNSSPRPSLLRDFCVVAA